MPPDPIQGCFVTGHYRRTEKGWLILFLALVPTIGIAAMVATQGVPLAAVLMLGIAAAIALSFGWLAIAVDEETVSIRFGVGLVRRTIPLSTIRGARVAEPPTLAGLGARWLGGRDWLYNVSNGRVVQLVLDDGRQVLIGTPEPDALLAAIRARQPEHRHAHMASAPSSDRSLLLAPAFMLVVFGVVGVMLYRGSWPSTITLDATALTIRGGGYTSRTLLGEITAVTLSDTPPAMDARTGGFAFNGHRRGNFTSNEFGKGMIFTDRGHSPYLLLRTSRGFVLFNTPSSDSTRVLAARLGIVKQ